MPACLAESEQLLKLRAVEANHHLAINDRNRRRPHSKFQQFLQGLLIFANIFCHERHCLLRKKLFLLITGPSAGLGIDDHLFRHDVLLVMLRISSDV